MNLRTAIKPESLSRKINLADPILTIGSCFADSMGEIFRENKLKVMVNPFGSIYHPNAIHNTLISISNCTSADPQSYLERDGHWYHYQYHSRFSGKNKAELSDRIEKAIHEANRFLKECRVLMITYGTAWLYEKKDSAEAVANCHKMPASLFSKRLSPVEEIVNSFREWFKVLKKQNPSIQVVLTISPVRHIKDSLEGNSVSKAILRTASHQIVSEFGEVSYFPAFEIMMDDLRDYRFYKDDLIHPAPLAEKYIWEKFCQAAFEPQIISFLSRWDDIRQSLGHRPFNPGSPGHREFLNQTLKKLETLSPMVNVAEEIAAIQEQIQSSHS